MDISSKHTQKIFQRQLKAALLATIFSLMVVIQLVPVCQQTVPPPQAIPVECSGDCNLCGCSPQSRASNTCCCSKKKQQQTHVHEDGEDSSPDCCKQKPIKKKTIIACGCPCGNGKQAALSVGGTSEVLPYHFTEQFRITHTDTTYTSPTRRLTSRYIKPPVPPPRQTEQTSTIS